MGFRTVEGKDLGNVQLFTMSTCAWCDKMKELLSDNHVKYSYIDLDLVEDQEQDAVVKHLDSIYEKWGFPSLLFDERVLICGYREQEILELLGLSVQAPGEGNVAKQPTSEEVEKAFERIKRYNEKRGYFLNPDTALAKRLVSGLLVNQQRYGYWACPCRLASGNKQEDKDIICPCEYREPDVLEFGACYCALFVSPKVVAGEMEIKTVPERRVRKSQ
jgi:ferredoxin-thioredoxin reductase catalytic subunit/glutaredoxin